MKKMLLLFFIMSGSARAQTLWPSSTNVYADPGYWTYTNIWSAGAVDVPTTNAPVYGDPATVLIVQSVFASVVQTNPVGTVLTPQWNTNGGPVATYWTNGVGIVTTNIAPGILTGYVTTTNWIVTTNLALQYNLTTAHWPTAQGYAIWTPPLWHTNYTLVTLGTTNVFGTYNGPTWSDTNAPPTDLGLGTNVYRHWDSVITPAGFPLPTLANFHPSH